MWPRSTSDTSQALWRPLVRIRGNAKKPPGPRVGSGRRMSALTGVALGLVGGEGGVVDAEGSESRAADVLWLKEPQ